MRVHTAFRALLVVALAAPAAAQVVATEDALLTPPTPHSWGEFGYGLALDGATLAATEHEVHLVQLYDLVGGAWSYRQTLTGSGSWFAHQLALDGDVLAATGAAWGSSTLVHVWARSGGTWTAQATLPKLEGNDGPWDTQLALSGERLLVGVGSYDHDGVDAGAAYVYRRNGASWALEQELRPATVWPTSHFGAAVALDGDWALVSQPGPAWAHGVVLVYQFDGAHWRVQGRLRSPSGVVDNGFGTRVALAGDLAAVSELYGDLAAPNAGEVHLYRRSGATWTYETALLPAQPEPYGTFGTSLAATHARVVVGTRYGRVVQVHEYGAGVWSLAALAAPALAWRQQHELALALSAEHLALGNRYEWIGGVQYVGAVRTWDLPLAAPVRVACAGDGTLAPCPCGNDVLPGAQAGCRHSEDRGALLGAAASVEVARDDLAFYLWEVPRDQVAMLFGAPLTAAPAPFGDGLRCLGGGVVRLGLRDPLDLVWSGGLAAALGALPGESWTFQAAFRDPAGPCGGGYGWSEALELTWQ
ncbi:MAG: hypothetical protein H6828_00120 [Planctomycetes bacterium]|nr:hypothetical protein [Planctomycetota bacterium]